MLQGVLHRLGLHVWIGRHLHVARYAPKLAGWPAAHKLRIVMLSDFHIGEPWTGRRALRQIVARANGLNPDIVLLLGDYVEGPRYNLPVPDAEWAGILAGLSAPLGVHAVLGNHDYPGGRRQRQVVDSPPAQQALEGAGIPVYVNQAVRIGHGDAGFWLAGLGDQMAGRDKGNRLEGQGLDDLPGTLAQVTTDEPIILMAHEPDVFPQVPERVSLTLSGHLHGGQVKFFGHAPVVPSRYGQRYLHGHIEESGRSLIVGAGFGHSGFPIRLHAPPEIVVIDLGQDSQ